MQNRLKKELNKVITKVMTFLTDQDNVNMQKAYQIDRIDRMYSVMKKEMMRHETLCFEIATKFEQQHSVILKLVDNIDALKTYSIVNDLHMEAYLPL